MRSLILICGLVGCLNSAELGSTRAAISDPTLVSDKTAYSPGEAVVVTWTGLPGNATDWVAVAPSGSSLTATRWTYVGGLVDGSFTFNGLVTSGDYVARAFSNDSYDLVVESSPFTIGTTGGVTTDFATYAPAQGIVVSWTGLPGNTHDWIALAPEGASAQTTLSWIYTNGAASGSHAFAGLLTSGSYVARAFLDDGYTLLDESPVFSVAPSSSVSVTTSKSIYSFTENVTISWAGLPGNAKDWVATAVDGSATSAVLRWTYTGGQTSGSAVFQAPTSVGSYVARAFLNDTFVLAAESSPFTMQTPVTTDATTYQTNSPIMVSWESLPPNPDMSSTELRLVPAGSAVTQTGDSIFVPLTPGSHVFPLGCPTEGTWVARLVRGGTTIIGESAPFTVAGTAITLTMQNPQYSVNQLVEMHFTNLPAPTSGQNWIGLAPVGSPIMTVLHWSYIDQLNGDLILQGPAVPGTYVARAFANDSYDLLKESATFVVE